MIHNTWRIGQGYDVHRFEVGRKLVLGGIVIPFHMGLDGHSDADVLTHAIIDAILGAAGLGDIGKLFPDNDPRYENISSVLLLKIVSEKLIEKSLNVANIDATVIAQAPKIYPYTTEMERVIAGALQVEQQLISVKATTTERLGFVGREEGMAAQAVALLHKH